MNSTKLPYLHAFNCIPSIGPKNLEKISGYFSDDFQCAWKATEAELLAAGLSQKIIVDISEKRGEFNPEKTYAELESYGIVAIPCDDAGYPALLRATPYAPALLYVRGSLPANTLTLAVVGTRIPTTYGRNATEKLVQELARANITIVSGLALGIDGIAHTAALEARGKTIAVLGSGIDDQSIYPSFHKPLAKRILMEGGAIISEFPPGTRAMKQYFPQRNRIIAGLARGTIVIEAKKESGALITARYALDYNRDIFAVPGSIFSALSVGPHSLIKEGAMPVMSAADILDAYGIAQSVSVASAMSANVQSLTETEQKILQSLDSPKTFGELQHLLALDTPILNAALTMLELNEYVKNIGNRAYIRK